MIKKGREPSASLEALSLLSRLEIPRTGEDNTSLSDPPRRKAFLERVSAGMDESLAQQARLHGWRVQGLFESLIVHLGRVKLIKSEDVGTYFFDDKNGPIKPPDFRVVTERGEQLLIEVKNVPPKSGEKARRLRLKDVDQERRYAELAGARLLLAHYWSSINMWTAVDPSVLKARGGHLELSFETAILADELGRLGDRLIDIHPPLRCCFVPNPKTVHRATENSESSVKFEIADWWMVCGEQSLTREPERTIAWHLMFHFLRDWKMVNNERLCNDGRIETIELEHVPPKTSLNTHGYAHVNFLSRIFSAMYNSTTLDGDKRIRELRYEPEAWVAALMSPETLAMPIRMSAVLPSLGPTADRQS